MAPPTPQELDAKREEHCYAISPERKYYRFGDTTFIKRSLRPWEWQSRRGEMHVPLFNTERVLNEGACLAFLAEHAPSIPIPKLYACYEDDCAGVLVTEYVQGVGMNELEPEQRTVVEGELKRHLETMRSLTSEKWGGPTGLVLPPHRIMKESKNRWRWDMRPREDKTLVFCHNDLAANNVIVDPDTLKIKAIIDWEYAGFYPPQFEAPFYLRNGLSVALEGEVDDVAELLELIDKERE